VVKTGSEGVEQRRWWWGGRRLEEGMSLIKPGTAGSAHALTTGTPEPERTGGRSARVRGNRLYTLRPGLATGRGSYRFIFTNSYTGTAILAIRQGTIAELAMGSGQGGGGGGEPENPGLWASSSSVFPGRFTVQKAP